MREGEKPETDWAALYARLTKRQQEAWSELLQILYSEEARMLPGRLDAFDSADVLHDALLFGFHNIETLRSPGALRFWFRTILRRSFYNLFRRRKRNGVLLPSGTAQEDDLGEVLRSSEEIVFDREKLVHVFDRLEDEPVKKRAVLEKMMILISQGLSEKQAAEVAAGIAVPPIKPGTAESWFDRFKSGLRAEEAENEAETEDEENA